MLDVLFQRQKVSSVAWTSLGGLGISKLQFFFNCKFFSSIFSHKNPGSIGSGLSESGSETLIKRPSFNKIGRNLGLRREVVDLLLNGWIHGVGWPQLLQQVVNIRVTGLQHHRLLINMSKYLNNSVPDPDVLGPTGSGSGSSRKSLLPSVLCCDFFMTFYLWRLM